jgi:hypothetical protein
MSDNNEYQYVLADFSTFEPPKELSKTNKQDFLNWFEEFNHFEVLRFVYYNWINDYCTIMYFLGTPFTEEELNGCLKDFSMDKNYRSIEYCKEKMLEYLDDWMEVCSTVSVISSIVIDIINEEDVDSDDEDYDDL